jgi:hypothetical protein
VDCPACGAESSVQKSMSIGAVVVRRRKCACGARWATEETLKRGSLVATGGHTGPPLARKQPPVTTAGHGGVGGGLSGDLDPKSEIRSGPISNPDPDPPPNVIQGVGLAPFRAPAQPYPVGAATLPFLDVYDRYPKKHKKLAAAAVFQGLAAAYPGGETALSVTILARFDAGLLRRHPYAGDIAKCPTLETFLIGRCWEDGEDAPVDVPARDSPRRDPLADLEDLTPMSPRRANGT